MEDISDGEGSPPRRNRSSNSTSPAVLFKKQRAQHTTASSSHRNTSASSVASNRHSDEKSRDRDRPSLVSRIIDTAREFSPFKNKSSIKDTSSPSESIFASPLTPTKQHGTLMDSHQALLSLSYLSKPDKQERQSRPRHRTPTANPTAPKGIRLEFTASPPNVFPKYPATLLPSLLHQKIA